MPLRGILPPATDETVGTEGRTDILATLRSPQQVDAPGGAKRGVPALRQALERTDTFPKRGESGERRLPHLQSPFQDVLGIAIRPLRPRARGAPPINQNARGVGTACHRPCQVEKIQLRRTLPLLGDDNLVRQQRGLHPVPRAPVLDSGRSHEERCRAPRYRRTAMKWQACAGAGAP